MSIEIVRSYAFAAPGSPLARSAEVVNLHWGIRVYLNCARWPMWLRAAVVRHMADAGGFVTRKVCYADIKNNKKVDDGADDPAAGECDRGLLEDFSEA